jgi:hypothetical protein
VTRKKPYLKRFSPKTENLEEAGVYKNLTNMRTGIGYSTAWKKTLKEPIGNPDLCGNGRFFTKQKLRPPGVGI